MKILHVITTLDHGGAERQLVKLVNSQIQAKNDVWVIYLKGDGALGESLQGATVKSLVDLGWLRQLYVVRQILLANNFSLICSHLPRAEITLALATLFFKTIMITTKHNAEKFWPGGPGVISRLLARLVARRSACTICISEGTRSFLVSIREIKESDEVKVVPYGIEAPSRYVRNSQGVDFHSGNKTSLRIICVARLVPQKNLAILIKAIPFVANANPLLRIFGDGPERESLSMLIKRLSLEDKVLLMGKSAHIESEYDESDILVLPSKYEGFGLVLLEAMRHQLRIVASDIPVTREVLGEDYPFLAQSDSPEDFAKNITNILNWSQKEVALFCRQRLIKFNLNSQYTATDQVYRACLERAGRE